MAYQWSEVNYLSQRSTRAVTQSVCVPDFPVLILGILQVWRSRALSRSLRVDKMKRQQGRSNEETLGEEKSSHVEWDESIHPFSLMSTAVMTSSQPHGRIGERAVFGLLQSANSRTLGSSSARQNSNLCSYPYIRHTLIRIIEAFVSQCYQEQFNNL